jgi:hypothetical protein
VRSKKEGPSPDRAAVFVRVYELALGRRDLRPDGARREPLRVDLKLLGAALHHAQRVGLVVDGEGALVAEPRSLGAQDAGAGRVERHHPHQPRDTSHELLDAFAHLAGGLVGERDRENLTRQRLARGQQVGDPVRENARLSGAGAGEHQERPLTVRNRLPLRRVQLGEQALDLARARLDRSELGLRRHGSSIATATACAGSRRG